MKSKISLILLSGLLVTQATMPMETRANSALKKVQTAGKIALKLGLGTATLGIYALMGTAALTSLGLTIGAAAAVPFLYYARYLKPKLAIPASPMPTFIAAPEKLEIKPKLNPSSCPSALKKPVTIPGRSKNTPSNRVSLAAKTAVQAASLLGLAVIENDLPSENELRETRERANELVKQQARQLQAELEKCHEQSIQWNTNYTRTHAAELPRYEGPYQDMIGIYDGDIEDMISESRMQIKQELAHKWEQAGCKESMKKLQTLARKMAQQQMLLSNKI